MHSPPSVNMLRKSRPPASDPLDFRLRLRQGALDAVHQINVQFVALLCERAGDSSRHYPLPPEIRERFAGLPKDARARVAASPVLLADMGFSRADRWRAVLQDDLAHEAEAVNPEWAPHAQMSALAHSMLLVGWYIVQANPPIASVLLEMPADAMRVYRELGINDIALIAQQHANWVRPRWEANTPAWSSLLGEPLDVHSGGSCYTTLRTLQLCGGRAGWLAHYQS